MVGTAGVVPRSRERVGLHAAAPHVVELEGASGRDDL
jgi:hypothetical protein